MNMQNLPRDKARSKLRAAVTARPGEKLITGDLARSARITAKLCGQRRLGYGPLPTATTSMPICSNCIQPAASIRRAATERFIGKTRSWAWVWLRPRIGFQMWVTQARQYNISLTGYSMKRWRKGSFAFTGRWFSRIRSAWYQLEPIIDHHHQRPNTHLARCGPDTGPLTFKTGIIVLPKK